MITFSWDQGLLVYANRGTEEDFLSLHTQGITLEGTIALTRYGGAGRGAKVSGSPQGGELGGGAGVRASCRQEAGTGRGQSRAGWCAEPWAGAEEASCICTVTTHDALCDPGCLPYTSEPWEISGSGRMFHLAMLESKFSCGVVLLNIQLKSLLLPPSQPASFQLKILTKYVTSMVF